ncbi:MAG: hypothetical protein M3340_08965 [Actinomycetota bacterium]|nr:hypothetical protein [Actinomycetota bacterium]
MDVVRLAVAALAVALVVAVCAPAAALEPYETVLASRQNAGDGGAPHHGNPPLDVELSGNGRFVVFTAESTNLAPGVTDATRRAVYLRDLDAGTTSVVANDAFSPSISHDGRFVAYDVVQDGIEQVVLRDRMTGATSLVSRANGADGAPGSGHSFAPSVSADGRYVLFQSHAENLDPSPRRGVFLRDTREQRTVRLGPVRSRNWTFWSASLSANGRYAVVTSTESYDPCCSEAYRFRVHLHDLRTGRQRVIYRLNRDGLDQKTVPSISATGRWVVIEVPYRGMSIYDARKRSLRLVSRRPVVRRGERPTISANGRYVAFSATGRSLRGIGYAWLFDRRRGRLDLASRESGRRGASMRGYAARLSADGRVVAFGSKVHDRLSDGPHDDAEQVFARRVLP